MQLNDEWQSRRWVQIHMTVKDGRHLRAARVLADLSQRELAAAAGLHVNAVKYWERRKDRIGGYAVDLMLQALSGHGIRCGIEYEGRNLLAVLRG